MQSRLADNQQFTPLPEQLSAISRFNCARRALYRCNLVSSTICTVQWTAGKPRFRESKQLRALRRLGYLLKTYSENSFSRARAFTNFRQIGAFGNHLLQLATLLGGGVGERGSGGVGEWGREGESGRGGESGKSSLFLLPSSLFLLPSSLFLVPCSLFLVPSSLFLVPSDRMATLG